MLTTPSESMVILSRTFEMCCTVAQREFALSHVAAAPTAAHASQKQITKERARVRRASEPQRHSYRNLPHDARVIVDLRELIPWSTESAPTEVSPRVVRFVPMRGAMTVCKSEMQSRCSGATHVSWTSFTRNINW